MSGTDVRTPPTAAAAGARRRAASLVQGAVIALGFVLMVGGFAVIALNYRPYQVPTASMAPTVKPGDTVLGETVGGGSVGRGDIVVFQDPLWGSAVLVKRVVGVGGDTVVCCDAQNRLTVNGKPIAEPYLAEGAGAPQGKPFSTTVPQGRLFLLGDARLNSLDSRFHLDVASGTVPASDVLARVEATVQPLDRAGFLRRTVAFDDLGAARASEHGPLEPAALASVGGAVLIVVASALGGLVSLAGRLRRRRS